MKRRSFFSSSFKSHERIGPHDKIIIDILFGTLLGGALGEKRQTSSRFSFHQSNKNIEYLKYLVKIFTTRGYCSKKDFKLSKQIGKKNQVYFSLKKTTYSFSSLSWIYDSFYGSDKIKKIPKNINCFLTPRALAFWIMDNGSRTNSGVILSMNSFKKDDVYILQSALKNNFGLNTNHYMQNNQIRFYFSKSQIVQLIKIIKPYMQKSMIYKIKT